MWRSYLTGDGSGLDRKVQLVRGLFRHLPSDPRCRVCNVPFTGLGGRTLQTIGYTAGRSELNPTLCGRCERMVKEYKVGVEVDVTLLFADVRGSTALAEEIGTAEFRTVIDRFYRVATEVMIGCGALIEALIGDEVAAIFAPGIAGPDHGAKAVEAARRLLRAIGYGHSEGPWIRVGAGVHAGTVFAGAVGTSEQLSVVTVLGDAANTTSRLAGAAAGGEILVTDAAVAIAGLALGDHEERRLELKGRSEAIAVRVVRVGA